MNPEAYLDMAATEERHWWFVARRRILADLIGRMGLPQDAEILEVGCGTGGNLALLGRFGRVFAVEMDATARAIAEQKTDHRFEIRPGRCPDAMPFLDRRFDLICLFDVLEHIEEDTASLRMLGARLKENGRILLTVPALPWLWSPHDEYLHHHRRYSRRALVEAITEGGYRVERLSFFNTLLSPLAVVSRIIDKLADSDKASGTVVPNPLVNRSLQSLFASERFLLRHFNLPFGISLIAVLAPA